MINKKILMSGISIVASLSLMGGAAFAFFSDQVSSNNNTFSTGVLNLEIRDIDEGFTNIVSASTVALNLTPGGPVNESYVCFRNTGNYPIEEILLSMSATGDVNELSPYVNATKVELKAVSATDCADFASGSFTGADDFTPLLVSRFDGSGGQPSEGTVSLYEALSDVLGDDRDEDDLLDGPAVLPADPSILLKFRTTWQLGVNAPNTAQGKSVSVNTNYVGNQTEN